MAVSKAVTAGISSPDTVAAALLAAFCALTSSLGVPADGAVAEAGEPAAPVEEPDADTEYSRASALNSAADFVDSATLGSSASPTAPLYALKAWASGSVSAPAMTRLCGLCWVCFSGTAWASWSP